MLPIVSCFGSVLIPSAIKALWKGCRSLPRGGTFSIWDLEGCIQAIRLMGKIKARKELLDLYLINIYLLPTKY